MQAIHPVHSSVSQDINTQSMFSGAADSSGSSAQTIAPVDAGSVIGLKRAALEQCLRAPEKVPVKLKGVVKLEMKVVNGFVKAMRTSGPDQKQKLVESFVNEVFTKAGMNSDLLTRIGSVLGVQEVNSVHEQDAMVVSEAPTSLVPTVSEDEYIQSLGDDSLNNHRKSCQHVQYDMDHGRYTYHTSMISRFGRHSDQVDSAFQLHRQSGARSRYGIVTKTASLRCDSAQYILSNPKANDEPLVEGDSLAMRRLALLDTHACNMHSLLNRLQKEIERFGLPDDFPLAVKVAVADGYRASYVTRAQQSKEGLHWQREIDPDNLVASDNLLRITFNTKKDLSELISSGKTLGDLASGGQVVIALTSKYAVANQELILSQAKGLSVRSEDYHENKPVQVGCTSYFFKDGRFGKGLGGTD